MKFDILIEKADNPNSIRDKIPIVPEIGAIYFKFAPKRIISLI